MPARVAASQPVLSPTGWCPVNRDYRDLALTDAIDQLVATEHERDDACADAASYRAVAQAALHRLAELATLAERQRRTIASLHDMLRDQHAAQRERAA